MDFMEDEKTPEIVSRKGYMLKDLARAFVITIGESGPISTGKLMHYTADMVCSGGLQLWEKLCWDYAYDHIGVASPRIFHYLFRKFKEINGESVKVAFDTFCRKKEVQELCIEIVLILQNCPKKSKCKMPAATQMYLSDSANTSMSLLLGARYVSSSASYASLQGSLSGVGPTYLCLNPAGSNVGIGITNPAYTLDVSGNIRVFGANGIASFGNVVAPVTPVLGATTNSCGLFSAGVSNNYGLNIVCSGTGVVHLQNQRFDALTMVYGMSLNPMGGNVGIGTTNPQYTLDVAGSAHVNGTITANIFNTIRIVAGCWAASNPYSFTIPYPGIYLLTGTSVGDPGPTGASGDGYAKICAFIYLGPTGAMTTNIIFSGIVSIDSYTPATKVLSGTVGTIYMGGDMGLTITRFI